MDRTLRFIDSAASVVLASTVIAIAVWILCGPPSFGASPAGVTVNDSPDIQIAMRWVQPIVGQAIVEDILLTQRYGRRFTSATLATNLRSRGAHRADLSARLASQWVMGRVIVALTRQELRDDTPAEVQFQEKVNRRIIALARAVGANLDHDATPGSQVVLGRSV